MKNPNRKKVPGSPLIIEELVTSPFTTSGYWQSRGIIVPSMKDVLKVPFHDFLESNSVQGKKKNLLYVPNHSSPFIPSSMAHIYKGVTLTQRVTIAMGFFLYSASVFNMHMLIAQASKTLEVPAVFSSVVSTDSKEGANLLMANIVMEVCARMLYEGAGSLGGYSENVWLLWGKLRGIACPTNDSVLTLEEAKEWADYYRSSDLVERKLLFVTWFKDAYEKEFSHKALLDLVASNIWYLYERYQTYMQYERGMLKMGALEKAASEGDEWWYEDMVSILTGAFRRLSKGVNQSAGSTFEKSTQLVKVLDLTVGDVSLTDLFISSVFSDYQGNLTTFARWLSNSLELAFIRVEITEDMIEEREAAIRSCN